MTAIRYFRNYDAPAVADLWTAQRREMGIESPISLTAVEVVVLGRPFFTEKNLLIAADEAGVEGYVHWLLTADRPEVAVIAGLAVAPRTNRDEIACRLLEQSAKEARAAGAKQLLLGQAPEHWTGYAGLGRCGSGSGISEDDTATRRWAKTCGFTPARDLISYVLNVSTYRPAFDRDLLALRRVASVDRRRDVTDQPFRVAAAMSHLEMHRFVATERGGAVISEADMLVSDPEMMIVSGGTVLLSQWRSAIDMDAAKMSAAIRFLLSSAIGELASERTNKVEATIEANNTADATTLQAIGFQVEQRGTIYERAL